MARFREGWLLGLGIVLGCSGAAHVRDGVGCLDDSQTLVLFVPATGDAAAASWVIRLAAPLEPRQAIRLSHSSEAAEYREGGDTPSFVSTDVDGILKRLSDRGGAEHYALKAVATHPSVDVQGRGRRGVEGSFGVERRSVCR